MLNRYLRTMEQSALFLCAFRPFFLATACSAVLMIAWWLLFLLTGASLPATAGGPFVWHAHEMIFGFAYAAVAGFSLTAVPEFTGSPAVARRPVLCLALLWLLARLAWSFSTTLPGLIISTACELAFTAGLTLLIAPRVWRDPGRRQLVFLWLAGALFIVTAGFYSDLWRGLYPMRWLWLCTGIIMALIIASASRISMSVVNFAIEQTGSKDREYLARPPRRNLVLFCIALFSAIEFFLPYHPVSGWVALAAAAAIFNLTNDWLVGRALLRRWVLMLFCAYLLMALGYAVIGFSILGTALWVSAGRHLLLIGAAGLSIFVVMNIAGRVHSGYAPDKRRWVLVAGSLIVIAAAARMIVAWQGINIRIPLTITAISWISAYGLHLGMHWRILTGPRPDNQTGCAGIAD